MLQDFGRIGVEERPQPTAGEGEVLIRTIATGICGSDVHGYTGQNGRRHVGQVMGHETVGVVVGQGPGTDGTAAVGSVVTVNPQLRPGPGGGARVLGVNPEISSAFAEYFVMPAENVVPLPVGMRVEHGALVEPLAVGYHAAIRGEVAPGQRVLVLGAGPIGLACVIAARRLGAGDILVSEPVPERRRRAARLGAVVIDPFQEDVAAFCARTGAVDVAIDAVGRSETIDAALTSVRAGGRVSLVGMASPIVEIPAYSISVSERRVVGSFCYTPEEFRETAAWASGEPALLDQLIDGRVTFDEADAAFSALAQDDASASKVLVYAEAIPA
ncbi:zinc-dependent alcohol dehydrogenase [Jiangella endophytica]|uniref:zinc-dependent alcohol dehydrogenase n=1 Tax=Jiangella endophytica TaxID=1623398 RepID=UPI0018E57990|nr:zinc-binding dehydrogenase [Jiangella endophytica]